MYLWILVLKLFQLTIVMGICFYTIIYFLSKKWTLLISLQDISQMDGQGQI